MYKQSLRETSRFDYKIYNKKGKKVPKYNRKDMNKMANYIDDELKLVRKIDRFMKENELSLLFDENDIERSIQQLDQLIDSYESIHVTLKRDLGDDEYATTLGKEYEDKIAFMTDWIRDAKLTIKRKKEKKISQLDNEKNELTMKGRNKLRAEEKYYCDRIKYELENMYLKGSHPGFIEDIEKNVNRAYELIQGYTEIFIRIEEEGKEFLEEFSNSHEFYSEKLNEYIKDAKNIIQNIKENNMMIAEDKRMSDEMAKFEREKRQKISMCLDVYESICERICNLELKCNIEIKDLTDNEILERKNELRMFDGYFNDLLDRILNLSKLNPNEINETENLLKDVNKRKNDLKDVIHTYKNDLKKEIHDRDLSDAKIKNASILEIKIPRFKGYNSSQDYYTFRAEFEKLVSPRIQKALLPEYLKNNYLEGHALQVVKELTDLDEIWDRLKTSFGDVMILMSNKMYDIEREVPLWKTPLW